MHALCAHAQGSVDLHVESYGVAGPLVETLYSTAMQCTMQLQYMYTALTQPRAVRVAGCRGAGGARATTL